MTFYMQKSVTFAEYKPKNNESIETPYIIYKVYSAGINAFDVTGCF
jgi:hypothetical protein